MTDGGDHLNTLVTALRERAKELNCLYEVEELLTEPAVTPDEACARLIDVIPPGWQYPDVCVVRIVLRGTVYETPGFQETKWRQTVDIGTQSGHVGTLSVVYTREMPEEDEGPFLKEERRLAATIADRLGYFVLHDEMRRHFQAMDAAGDTPNRAETEKWQVALDLLRRTDRDLVRKISQKLLYHLCWGGSHQAKELLRECGINPPSASETSDANRPQQARSIGLTGDQTEKVFSIAAQHLSDDALLDLIMKWLQEDRISFLANIVERNMPLGDVADAIRRYCHIAAQEGLLVHPAGAHVRVALIRRFLSEQLEFIRKAKEYVHIDDFRDLLPRIIAPAESYGRLGGKSAGLIFAAKVLKKERRNVPALGRVRTPKTWYVASDMSVHFVYYNNLGDVAEQKYKDLEQIRLEYPHIVDSCKNSRFPADLVGGLSVALDDFGDTPLIVRSSSVLEDRVGAAFSGKYKSLFVGNQGAKRERLRELLDAVAEVYASMFGPDPIQYRSERGLLDFAEEMGIIIQEVVGRRVGRYFFPLFAGVALSRNEFRWSPRIRREDGLTRMVPGLGTRAVDRVGDDYPVMFSPGRPGLRVNVSTDEVLKYSPRWMDVIDLEENCFVTLPVAEVIDRCAGAFPQMKRLFSVHEEGHLRPLSVMDTDVDPGQMIVTFDGQLADGRFAAQMQAILDVLERSTGLPVDIEFAHDGDNLFLLQCRSQSNADDSAPAAIPKDVPKERVVFSANRFVSNGVVPDITHIVYVSPEQYGQLSSAEELADVGRAVSELNKLLPKRQFILMGPGRWGSRGDVKLGVGVTYSDINNTAMLIEVAWTRGEYTPDLSFGTHFFQDLVEAEIRYLPLYPDDEGVVFNEIFLRGQASILTDVLPEFAHLSEAVRVIDVPAATGGLVLRVLMNADLDEAIGLLDSGERSEPRTSASSCPVRETAENSSWRLRMVEELGRALDPERYGVKALYVFGSAKNYTAGPASDIDLLVHSGGGAEQRALLDEWLKGWSVCLDEVNYLRTGYRSGGLLDVHIVTDDDIRDCTSYATKIGAVTDAARPVAIGGLRK